ncbi:MAG: DUF2207 domain-containing protein [Candidatus Omnitrophica bacterium]|nr:DUF2207 domain-containing protein [Candidatus Omnitrophota bacterium]
MSRFKPPGVFFGLLLAAVAGPRAAGAWDIADFNIQVVVHEDATASVTETIVADFGGESRHGLYRDIPIQYTDRAGQRFTLRLTVDDVGGGPVRLESAGRYHRIRIGDPSATVTGLQTYRIAYTVQRGAVRFFPDHDECYWNLTGNEWAVPIRHVRAAISLPSSARDLRAVGFIGGYGSTEQLRQLQRVGTQVVVEPPQALGPYEGLTAVVGWAKGAVHPPSRWQVAAWWLQDNWIYAIPLALLLMMWGLWWRRGRDPRHPVAQVVQYEAPEGLTPAEAGALVDERVHLRDITSTVIDLAVRGYLRIEPQRPGRFGLGADYRFVRLKSWQGDASLKPHERTLLRGVFGDNEAVELSELKYVFYERLSEIRKQIYAGLVTAGLFGGNPETIRVRYLGAGAVAGAVIFAGLLALKARVGSVSAGTVIVSVLSALVVGLFGQLMPRRTLKGAQATNRLGGFLEFLRRTDQDRIRRMNDPSLFERCLPYALAFGVADQWAQAFEGLYTQPPSWYAGEWDHFSARRFSHDLDRATSSMGQSFAATPRSQGSSSSWGGSGFGGGSSGGGGGGGGGGGAW